MIKLNLTSGKAKVLVNKDDILFVKTHKDGFEFGSIIVHQNPRIPDLTVCENIDEVNRLVDND